MKGKRKKGRQKERERTNAGDQENMIERRRRKEPTLKKKNAKR